jgi:hypothetical protein
MATEQEGLKIYVKREDADWLREHCGLTGLTVAGLIRRLLREYREAEEAKVAA